MSERLDAALAALAALDVGAQSPLPDPTFGEVSPVVSGKCARCNRRDPAADSEFCGQCRAFLLGDGPDPDARIPSKGEFTAAVEQLVDVLSHTAEQFVSRVRVLADSVALYYHDQHAATRIDPAYAQSLEPNVAWAVLATIADCAVFTHAAARPVYATFWCEPSVDPGYVLLRISWSSTDPGLWRTL